MSIGMRVSAAVIVLAAFFVWKYLPARASAAPIASGPAFTESPRTAGVAVAPPATAAHAVDDTIDDAAADPVTIDELERAVRD